MVPQAARTQFDTVEHQIIVRSAYLAWLSGQQANVLLERRHKRHVHIGELAVLGLFKEWEVHHKKRVPRAVSAPLQTLTKLDTQPAQDVTRQRRAVSDEE